MNNYPTIIVHGFLGAGEEVLLNKVYRDFGCFAKDLPKHLREQGYEVYQPGVGPINSVWDRCCILWAWLVGGTVDFGKVHSERNGHARYGRTYPGVLKDIGMEGAHKKMNLIGHSFGGPTVVLFASLLEAGSQEEREGTPEEELSDLFKGGHGEWVHSVTTLSGVLQGTSTCDFLGVKGRHFASYLLNGVGTLISGTPVAKVFDPMEEHIYNAYPTRREAMKALARSDDDVFWNMSVEFCKQQAKQFVMVPGAYYYCYRAQMTHDNGKGQQVANKGITPAFNLTSFVIDRYRNAALGIDDSWAASDGIVNVRGVEPPASMPSVEWSESCEERPGVWYKMPIQVRDHQTWIGMAMDTDAYYAEFDELLGKLAELE